MSDSLWPPGLQHDRLHYLLEFAQTHVRWVSDAIQLSHPLSLPSPFANFSLSQHQGLFQSIGASASQHPLPMNIQGWFPLGLTSLISLLSKGLSRIFPSTTVRKHQVFSAQPSLCSSFHICTWLLEKPSLWLDGPLSAKYISAFEYAV